MSSFRSWVGVLLLGLLGLGWLASTRSLAGSGTPPSTPQRKEPRPMTSPPVPSPHGLEVATLGGGCFWCVEAVLQELKGVRSVESGYAGGSVAHPTYRQVCEGTTGHAEVVQVTFEPAEISFGDLLEVFFQTHDPTTLDRQGNDHGPQYRSVIFYHSPAQREVAEQVRREAAAWWPAPIVTEISPFTSYYPAEDSHQDYYRSNPSQPYCSFVIAPKVRSLKERFRDRLREQAP